MSCLDNLIGVKGCGTTPHSFYINQLTGINVPEFDKALSAEKREAKTALEEIISFSTKLVETEINNYLEGRYQLKNIIENDVVGYYYEDKKLMPAQTGVLVGYEIKVDRVSYLTYFLSQIKLFCNFSGVVPVFVYDLIQDKLLDTINVTAIAGEIVTVSGLDKEYATSKQRLHLFIGYDSAFESYNTSYASPYGGTVGDYCNTCSGSYSNGYVYHRAAKINVADPKTNGYVQGNSISGGAGLSLSYSLQCSFTEILCNMRNRLALPILYKAGSQVMKELKHSKRLTGVVTVYGKSHEELELEYDNEYAKRMSNVLLNTEVPNGPCFKCTPRIKSVVATP